MMNIQNAGYDMNPDQTNGETISAKTVSDKIGQEYKFWNPNDVIFISSPTGSGKTTFVLNELLPYAILKHKRVLYLVNRSVLKKQLEENRNECARYFRNQGRYLPRIEDWFEIITYQTLETLIKASVYDPAAFNKVNAYLGYDYLIMDEAHYFMSDAVFNTSTETAFSAIMGRIGIPSINEGKQIRIFMSATVNNVKEYFKLNQSSIEWENSRIRNANAKPVNNNQDGSTDESQMILQNQQMQVHYYVREYDVPLEDMYRDLHIHLFDDYNSLEEIVCETKKSKWLIFVDNKEKGEKMNQYILDHGIQSVFISAQYKRDPATSGAVNTIIEERRIDSKVCIMTYVLDNGVSIEDDRTHIAIFADNKEQFLQCLGRSRLKDYSNAHLYIPKGSNRIFAIRKKDLQYTDDFVRYYDSIVGGVCCMYPQQMCMIIDAMCQNEEYYNAFKRVCYTYGGNIMKNSLSIAQIDYLYKIYDELLSKKDQWAFLRLQLQWINRDDDFKMVLNEYFEVLDKKILRKLEIGICGMDKTKTKSVQSVEMDRATVYEWYNLIHLDLKDRLNAQAGENIDEEVSEKYTVAMLLDRLNRKASITEKRDNQMIAPEMFNVIMNYLGYPYNMKRIGTKHKNKNGETEDNVRWLIERTEV